VATDLEFRLIKHFRVLELVAGDPLPREQDLVRDLQVSRPALREALAALEALGFVVSRQGARRTLGTFGMQTVVEALTRYIEPSTELMLEVLDVRRMLEAAFFPITVAKMSANTLHELRLIVDRMEAKAARGQPFGQEDAAFHRVLYEQLGNKTLQGLIAAFWRLFDEMSEKFQVGGDLQTTAHRHLRIVEMLEAGDTSLAAHELNVHFFDVRARFTSLRAKERAHGLTGQRGAT
jgi:DNA-binding FadR family transcriptional regulator